MASDFVKTATSERFQGSAAVMNKGKLPQLRIYVEDEEDQTFWRKLFETYTNDYRIIVSTYDCGDQKDTRGKDIILKAVSKHKINLSKTLLVGIDSDYDLLVDSNTYADIVRNNPFIIHTGGWYSMENMKCTPANVAMICYQLSLTEYLDIDFIGLYSEVSRLLSPLFLLSVVTKGKGEDYTIDEFVEDACKLSFEETGHLTDEAKKAIEKKIKSKKQLLEKYAADIATLQKTLASKGYGSETYIYLMNGHAIEESVTTPLIASIIQPIIKLKLANISKLKLDRQARKDLRNKIANILGYNLDNSSQELLLNRIRQMLHDCLNLQGTIAYDNVQQQIAEALKQ